MKAGTVHDFPAPLPPPVALPKAPPPRPVPPATMPNPWFAPVGWILFALFAPMWLVSELLLFPRAPEWVPGPALVLVVVVWLGSAALVFADAQRLNLQRLKLAKIKLTDSERTTPGDWALWVLVFWYVAVPWYLAVRRKNWLYALWAERTGEFQNKKQLRAALRAHRGLAHGQPIPA